MRRGRISARICSTVRPRLICFAARYSPLGVFTRYRSLSITPCLSAKLTAARVGSPTASYPTRFGGPVTSLLLSACLESSPLAHPVRRLGQLNVSTVPPSARLQEDNNFSRYSLSPL